MPPYWASRRATDILSVDACTLARRYGHETHPTCAEPKSCLPACLGWHAYRAASAWADLGNAAIARNGTLRVLRLARGA